MKPHIELAHHYWSSFLKEDDSVIDATCGNGHDTKVLAALVPKGKVFSYDIQTQALEKAKKRLQEFDNVEFRQKCHSELEEKGIKLVVYNLGYLPGGDKSVTTQVSTTLKSVKKAQELLAQDGMISITCYPGHEEGEKEQETLLEYVKGLDSNKWLCCHHNFVNRPQSPTLLIIRSDLRAF